MTKIFSVHSQGSGFPGQVFGICFRVLPRIYWAIWCFLLILTSYVDLVIFLARNLSTVPRARLVLHKY